MTLPRLPSVVLMEGASASTCTFSSTPPTASDTSMRSAESVLSCTLSMMLVLKPVSSVLSVYRPGGMAMNW